MLSRREGEGKGGREEGGGEEGSRKGEYKSLVRRA